MSNKQQTAPSVFRRLSLLRGSCSPTTAWLPPSPPSGSGPMSSHREDLPCPPSSKPQAPRPARVCAGSPRSSPIALHLSPDSTPLPLSSEPHVGRDFGRLSSAHPRCPGPQGTWRTSAVRINGSQDRYGTGAFQGFCAEEDGRGVKSHMTGKQATTGDSEGTGDSETQKP